MRTGDQAAVFLRQTRIWRRSATLGDSHAARDGFTQPASETWFMAGKSVTSLSLEAGRTEPEVRVPGSDVAPRSWITTCERVLKPGRGAVGGA